MSEQADTETPPPPDAQRLEQLEAENEGLRRQLQEIQAADEDRQTRQQRLDRQEQANRRLRTDLAEKALREALRAAADNVGVDADLALLQSHRFQCAVGEDGTARIEPNPTETFLELVRSDPLFRRSNRTVAERRRHRPAIAGTPPDDDAEIVELLGYLDRNPARRYEFVRRHGREKFFDLLRAARRKGYRRRGA